VYVVLLWLVMECKMVR